MNISARSFGPKVLRNVLNDALYRGSMTLLANAIATAAIGLVFWTLAAHSYPVSTVGVFSSVTSGVGLLATIAALGLPITMIRHVAGADHPRELVILAVRPLPPLRHPCLLVNVPARAPPFPPARHPPPPV